MRFLYATVVADGLALGTASDARAQFSVSIGNPYSGGVVVGNGYGNGYGYGNTYGYGNGYGYGTGVASPYYGTYSSGYAGYGAPGVYSSGYTGVGVVPYSGVSVYSSPVYSYGSYGYGYPSTYGYGYGYPRAYGYRYGGNRFFGGRRFR